MKRRNFIKKAGKAAPLAYIAPSFLLQAFTQQTAGGSVIIVGAGAAGLYAAKVLKDAGINVTVLEASSVHGGRIKPLNDFSSIPIEIGAEEVHGKANAGGDPPSFLWSSINDYDPSLLVEYATLEIEEIFALDDGYVTYPPYWDPDLEAVESFINTMYMYSGDDVIMHDYLNETFGITEGDRTWHLYEAWIGAEWGSSIKDYGMKSMAVSENLWLTGGKNYALNASYLQVLETLWFTSVLPDIEYNKQVTGIDYSGASVNVSCSDGSTYSADKLICTVPLSILKEGSIGFTPALPALNQNAIDILQMGKGMKIVLKFSEKFWGDNVYDITFKSYPTEAWSPGMIRSGGIDNILLCFCMGERAEYLSSLGDDAITAILAELDALFDGAASETFTDAIIQDWIKEPFIKGSYSYPAPGTYLSESDSRRLDLATQVDCKIFFAGEATSNNHPATVHGALESGARAAAEVLECFSVSVPGNGITQNNVTISSSGETLSFHITAQMIVKADMFLQTIDGKLIQRFYHDYVPAGENRYTFQFQKLPAGFYFACCRLNELLITEKILI
jgi:lysine-specific histone demethylase 1B